jgi:hypothetical protein
MPITGPRVLITGYLAQVFQVSDLMEQSGWAIAAAEPGVSRRMSRAAGGSHHEHQLSRHQGIIHDREDFMYLYGEFLTSGNKSSRSWDSGGWRGAGVNADPDDMRVSAAYPARVHGERGFGVRSAPRWAKRLN